MDNNVRQTEIHTAEPIVPEPNAVEVEMTIEKVKKMQITSTSGSTEHGA
jgi:hypothetical protein